MPPRGPKESALGLLSLIAWVPAILGAVLVLPWLPTWLPGRPPPPGTCYFTSSLIVFVECKGTLADRFFAKLLNFVYYWTVGLPWMAAFMPPVVVVWLLSIYFAFRFVTSRFAPPER